MRTRTVYICKTCGFENYDAEEVKVHEASHLGLTVEEMETYTRLNSKATHMGYHVGVTNNEKTRSQFDEAIKELLNFERQHGIGAEH